MINKISICHSLNVKYIRSQNDTIAQSTETLVRRRVRISDAIAYGGAQEGARCTLRMEAEEARGVAER